MQIIPVLYLSLQAALPNILKKTTQEFHEQTLRTLCLAADICYSRAQKLDVLCCHSKPQGSMFLMVKKNFFNTSVDGFALYKSKLF